MTADVKYPFSLPDAKSAVEVLDRMAHIVKAEQTVHGSYVGDVVDEGRASAGALCGGHHFCAIGSCWFAAGVPIVESAAPWGLALTMPGAMIAERAKVVADRPFLAEARVALNEVAQQRLDSGSFEPNGIYAVESEENPDAIEVLFENYEVTTADLLAVIAEARANLVSDTVS